MSKLLLPSSLVDELAEERALELVEERAPMSVESPVWFQTRTDGQMPTRLPPDEEELLRNQRGWAQIANRALMDRIGELDWFVGERRFDVDKQTWEIDALPQHPANQILMAPNPIFDGQLIRMLIAGLVAHTGVCYLQKIRDGLGRPVELWPLPTQFTEPVSMDGKVIGAYRVWSQDGGQIDLPVEDVIRIWRPDLRTLYGSLGMLAPQATVASAQEAMNQQKKSHFDRDAIPRSALLAKENTEPPGKEARRNFKAAWRQAYDSRFGTDRGTPAYIPPGFEIHEFSQQSASQDVELDMAWAKQIMAGYGVPMFAVGIDTNVNRATGETVMWAWDQNSIKPMTALMANAFTYQMMIPDFGPGLAVTFQKFVAPDKEFELQRERHDLDTGKRSIDEVRESQDMGSVPWGRFPRGTLAEEPYTGQTREPEPPPPRSAQMPRPMQRADVWDPATTFARNEAIEDQFVSRWRRRQSQVFGGQLAITLERYAKAVGVEASALRGEGNAKARRELERAERGEGRFAGQRAGVTVEDIFTVGSAATQALYEELIQPLRSEIYLGSAEFAQDSVPGREFFETPSMRAEINDLNLQQIAEVDATTAEQLRRELVESDRAGESIQQTAQRIVQVFTPRSRPETIARTEIGKANQAATMAGFRSSGVVDGKQWNSSRDGAVRDSHQIDGQRVALDERFTLGSGVTADAPLDSSLPAGETVNCRCFVTPVLISEVV